MPFTGKGRLERREEENRKLRIHFSVWNSSPWPALLLAVEYKD